MKHKSKGQNKHNNAQVRYIEVLLTALAERNYVPNQTNLINAKSEYFKSFFIHVV